MNIIIFCLTILACYGIITLSAKAWKKADVSDKMEEIEDIEELNKKIKEFKKTHKGDLNKKREVIEDFKQE